MIPHDCDLHNEQMHVVTFLRYDTQTRLIHFFIECELCPGFGYNGTVSPMDWLRLLVQLKEDNSDSAN